LEEERKEKMERKGRKEKIFFLLLFMFTIRLAENPTALTSSRLT